MDVLLDGVDVLCVLFGGVGVIHPQVADALVLLRRAKVNGQRLAVADVEIPVGLRWEPGVNLFPLAAATGLQFLLNDAMNEIGAHGLFRHGPHAPSPWILVHSNQNQNRFLSGCFLRKAGHLFW